MKIDKEILAMAGCMLFMFGMLLGSKLETAHIYMAGVRDGQEQQSSYDNPIIVQCLLELKNERSKKCQ